jgi:SAM-dependent methyltransferase
MRSCPRCRTGHQAPDWVCPACGAAPVPIQGILSFSAASDTASDKRSADQDANYLRSDLAAAERWHFWFQSRRRLVLWMLQRYFPNMQSLLDVGCGSGFVLEGVREQRRDVALSGTDAGIDALLIARNRMPDVFWFEALADGLPFEDEFDAVMALDVIEHMLWLACSE